MSKITWRGDAEMKRRLEQYRQDAKNAVYQIAQNYAPMIERDAKVNAPWEDRTANARQGLFAHVEQGDGRTTIYLSHQMDYGVYLELKFAGRFAIIMPTLERYYDPIMNSVKGLFD
jgi:hypothetical protein